MPQLDKDSFLIIAWVLTILIVGWTWFPAFLGWMGRTQFTIRGPFPIPERDPLQNDEYYRDWDNQLRNLGYELRGDLFPRTDFVEDQWRVESIIRWFAHPSKPIHVFVERLPYPILVWNSVELITCFSDNGLLLTKNRPVEDPIEDEMLIRNGIETYQVSELEQRHELIVDELKRGGRRADSDTSIERLLSALIPPLQERAKERGKFYSSKYLGLHGVIHATTSLPAVYAVGLDHWGVPITNLIICVVMRLGEFIQKRQIADAMRQAIQQRRVPQSTNFS